MPIQSMMLILFAWQSPFVTFRKHRAPHPNYKAIEMEGFVPFEARMVPQKLK
jgi:hypothetical protein